MRVRERKIFRDILARKRRTFLISTGIFIGVLGTVALFTMSAILLQRLREDIDNNDIAMLNTIVAAPLDTAINNDAYLDYMRSIIGITALEGSLRAPVVGELPGGEAFSGTMHGYELPFEALKLEPLRLLEGDYPAAADEVAVEIRFARDHDLQVGDTLSVAVTDASDASPARLTVTGIVLHAYNLSPEDAIFAPLPTANHLTNTNGFNVISSRFVDMETADATADHLSATLLHDTTYTPLQYHLQDPSFNPLTEGTERVTRTINLLALIALVMASFSVVNVINKIVREQKQQIGLLKAMGASRIELVWIYMGIAFLYGVIGVVPGILLGVPLGNWLAMRLAPEINTVVTEFSISWTGVGVGLLLGLVIPVLSAILPVLRGTRVSILEAITDRGIDEDYHDGLLAGLIHRLPLPMTLRVSVHELNKKKGRLFLTVLALTVASGAFMGVLVVFEGVSDEADTLIVNLNSELVTDVQNPYELTAALRMNVQPIVYAPGLERSLPMRSFNAVQNADFHVERGRVIYGEQEVIISDTVASHTRYRLDDTLELQLETGVYNFDIVGIVPYPTDMVWISDTLVTAQPRPNTFTATLIANHANNQVDAVGFDENLPTLLDYQQGGPFSETTPGVILSTPLAAKWDVKVGDVVTLRGASATTTQPIVGIFEPPSEIQTLAVSAAFVGMYWEDLATLEGYTAPAVISTPNDLSVPSFNFITLLQNFSVNLRTYEVLLSTVSLLIALVGGFGLLTTLSLSVMERQREIGVMRSVGARSTDVATQFLVQGVAIGAIAWLLGLPLSLWIAERLLIVSELDQLFSAKLHADVAAIGLLGVLLISAGASLWPALVAANSRVSDILRYQ